MNTIDCSSIEFVLAIYWFQIKEIFMNIKAAFAKSLKQARIYKGLTQESFSDVSSRTYLSTLERGLKSPTLEKIDDLSKTLKLHPLTLLAMTYVKADEIKIDELFEIIKSQTIAIEIFLKNSD